MATEHPVDAQGRVLPHSWWPAERQATGELEFVRRFCNSVNRENGAERFASAAHLDAWLIGEEAEPVAASTFELRRVIGVRDALRAVIVDRSQTTDTPWRAMLAACGEVELTPIATGEGIQLIPSGGPIERLIGRLLLAIVDAQHERAWRRLKACQHCHWIVFDPSKNASSRWCSMSACGGRHNARQYRRRQAGHSG